jgi:hypothetical protein
VIVLPMTKTEVMKLVELIELADENGLIFDRPTIKDIYNALRRRLRPEEADARQWRKL